jgi:agmatine deiminase
MAFPRENQTLGATSVEREEGYATWTAVAHAVAEFTPVTMLVDPSETRRAARMLSSAITQIERPIGEFWMRDTGPSFVHAPDGSLAAVDWVFNGWGGPDWAEAERDRDLVPFIADIADVPVLSSLSVNEGGAIHVDGQGTVLLTETVQLDPARNPHADKTRIEAEMARLLGVEHAVWLPRGLARDYETFGTKGHVDMVATFPSPGILLLHDQQNADHPDHLLCNDLRVQLRSATDARGETLDVISLPAPETLRDKEGFVDYSYVNHLVTNDGVISCAFGEAEADARAAAILADAYPGRRIVQVEARPLFARGGGIHCITQQQPKALK